MSYNSRQNWLDFIRHPDESSFKPIYESTKALAWTICYRILHTEEEAQDAFQGVWVRLMVAVRDDASTLKTRTPDDVVRRLAVLESDRLRKKRSRRSRKEFAVERLPYDAADASPSADRLAAENEIRARVEALVETLPEPYRLPVFLHYFHDMTHQQIGEMLDKPTSTISTQISRGVKKLRPQAERQGINDVQLALGTIAAASLLLQPPAHIGVSASQVFLAAQSVALKTAVSTGSMLTGSSAGAAASAQTTKSTFAMVASSTAVIAAMIAPVVLIVTFATALGQGKRDQLPEIVTGNGEHMQNMAEEEGQSSRPVELDTNGNAVLNFTEPEFDRTDADAVKESLGERAKDFWAGGEHEFRDDDIANQLAE